jgi:hypothetical protein
MSSYLPDILTYLAFGILMAVCLWYVDGSLKEGGLQMSAAARGVSLAY